MWAEPLREEFHRWALDACVRLAEFHSEVGQLDGAVATLERAISSIGMRTNATGD